VNLVGGAIAAATAIGIGAHAVRRFALKGKQEVTAEKSKEEA
jgi:hypothetical protein